MCAVSNSAGVRTSTTRGGVGEARSFSSSAGLIVAAAGAFMAFSLSSVRRCRHAQFWVVLAVLGGPSCDTRRGGDDYRLESPRSLRLHLRPTASETNLLSPRDAEAQSLPSCCAPTN